MGLKHVIVYKQPHKKKRCWNITPNHRERLLDFHSYFWRLLVNRVPGCTLELGMNNDQGRDEQGRVITCFFPLKSISEAQSTSSPRMTGAKGIMRGVPNRSTDGFRG
eukprot:1157939-Pelagomonas_calceolata.AAC.1